MSDTIYQFEAILNNGENINFNDYKGKVLLIVNTASKCGFTPQYDGLQSLYKQFEPQGLEVLGFPCDQFGHQMGCFGSEIGALAHSCFHRMTWSLMDPLMFHRRL